MNMKSLEKIHDMLCEELDEIVDRGELTTANIEMLDHITRTMKNINKILDRADNEDMRSMYINRRSKVYEQERGRETSYR